MEYGQDCDNLTHKKEKTVVNGSDVSLLLFDILPSTDYCYVVTADNGSHSIKVHGSFRGELYIMTVGLQTYYEHFLVTVWFAGQNLY